MSDYYSVSASAIAKLKYAPAIIADEKTLARGTQLHELLQKYLYEIESGKKYWASEKEQKNPLTEEEKNKIMKENGIDEDDTDGFNELFSKCSFCDEIYEGCIYCHITESMDAICPTCSREIEENIDADGKKWLIVMIDYIRDGRTPPTRKKKMRNIIISYKPDIENYKKTYEVKTCPIDDYAREQCRIFSFCDGEPIALLGWKDGKIEEEIIDGREWQMPHIPEEIMQTIDENQTEICFHKVVKNDCRKCEYEYESYFEKYEDEWEEI